MEMDANENQEQNPLRENHPQRENSRDPKKINKDVKVDFEDVIAEPDGTQSIDGVWKATHAAFTGSKNCCYRFLTLLCGIPCSLMWGCTYACTTFNHIWCVVPCIQNTKLGWKCTSQCCSLTVESCIEPCFAPVGKIISNIGVVLRKEH